MSTPLKPWVESVTPHPDVLAENFLEDIFALDLGPLSDGNPQVPAVYRDGLFAAWNALANLADMSGKVTVNVHAESEQGFDKSKLQNGVLEPLKEADLIQSRRTNLRPEGRIMEIPFISAGCGNRTLLLCPKRQDPSLRLQLQLEERDGRSFDIPADAVEKAAARSCARPSVRL